MTTVEKFLLQHKQASSQMNIAQLISAIDSEMTLGLGEGSCLPMIPTYLSLSRDIQRDDKRILIDAGGTNFRSAVGYFDNKGVATIEQLSNTHMPGSLSPIDAEGFFCEVADNIKHLLPNAGDIGFCFSYGVDMHKDIDGTVASMSKEVVVTGIEGMAVGANTVAKVHQIDGVVRRAVVLNDTVATLLGGYASNHDRQFASYIGYIYGTGLNLCYIEKTSNITKIDDYSQDDMIINIEAADFDKMPLGDYDKLAIANSIDSQHQLEKITSGKYLSEVMYLCMQGALAEQIFNSSATVEPFVLKDVSEFLTGEHNNIYDMLGNTSNRSIAKEMLRELIDRSAKLGAIFNSAIALRVCGDKSLPVAIVPEGSTFKKLTGYKANFVKYLDEILGSNHVKYELVGGEHLNLVGTLMATMVLQKETI